MSRFAHVLDRPCIFSSRTTCPRGVDVDPHLLTRAFNRNCTVALSCADRTDALLAKARSLLPPPFSSLSVPSLSAPQPQRALCLGPLSDYFFKSASEAEILPQLCAGLSGPRDRHRAHPDTALQAVARELHVCGLPLREDVASALDEAAQWPLVRWPLAQESGVAGVAGVTGGAGAAGIITGVTGGAGKAVSRGAAMVGAGVAGAGRGTGLLQPAGPSAACECVYVRMPDGRGTAASLARQVRAALAPPSRSTGPRHGKVGGKPMASPSS